MRTITIKDYEAGLQKLAKGCGDPETFAAKRKAWESTILVTDENGDPADTNLIEIEVKAAPKPDTDSIQQAIAKGFDEILSKMPKVGDTRAREATAEHGAADNGVEFKSIGFTRGYIPKFFKHGASVRENQDAAFKMGLFLRAVRGDVHAKSLCREKGIRLDRDGTDDLMPMVKGNVEGINTSGGVLVPDEMAGYLIRLVDDFGVFAQQARNVPMSSDSLSIGRRTGGYTAYFVGEAASPTESQLAFDSVKLSAKKLGVLTTVSNELAADSTIAFGDLVGAEMALAIADKQDDCGFNGTGTNTYGGIVGIIQRLSDTNGTDDGGGLVLATGHNTYAEVDTSDVARLMARVRRFPGMNNKFYCSQEVFGAILARLSVNAGNATVSIAGSGISEMQNTRIVERYLGMPVVICQKMPTAEANSQICMLYGDLSYSSTMGMRQRLVIRSSTDALNAFEQDETAYVAFTRFDIVNHDFGDSTTAGPVVGLILAAS